MADSARSEDQEIVADRVLDVRGASCPLPILRAKLTLGDMQPGGILHVLATDPHSVVDFKAFCARTGHELLRLVEGPAVFEFFVRSRAGTGTR